VRPTSLARLSIKNSDDATTAYSCNVTHTVTASRAPEVTLPKHGRLSPSLILSRPRKTLSPGAKAKMIKELEKMTGKKEQVRGSD
jgi:hypothetical protein